MNTSAHQQTPVDLSPAGIKEKIRFALEHHAIVDSDNIFVELKGDRVLLKGHVRSWTERKDAEDAAWSIRGIKEVENRIEVEKEIYTGE